MKHIVKVLSCLLLFTMAHSQLSKNTPGNPRTPEGLSDQVVPGVLSYQGVLTTASGAPASNGVYSLRFDFFNDTTGGASFWNETQNNVSVQGGTFHVALGSVNPFGPYLFNSPLFVEVTALSGPGISSSVTFSPRTPLTSAAYSLTSRLPFLAGVTKSSSAFEVWNNGTGSALAGRNYSGDVTTVGIIGTGLYGIGIEGDHLVSTGTAAGVVGKTQSTDAFANAVYGEVSNSSPGGSSSAVRGANNGTGGLGIGVYGSQNGSGWGVYGYTPSGLGVYGQSSSGNGVYGNSTSGNGVRGNLLGTAGLNSAGVVGTTGSYQPYNYGVLGRTRGSSGYYPGSGTSVFGDADSVIGVVGISKHNSALAGFAINAGSGVYGYSGSGYGVYSDGSFCVSGVSGDSSVLLPDDAVNSQEILDEPGVAAYYNPYFFFLSNTTANQTVDSVSISVPAAGKIVVQSSGYANFSHIIGTTENIGFNVLTNPTSDIFVSGVSSFKISSQAPTALDYREPFANLRIFDAPSAGTYKFYLVVGQFSGSDIGSTNVGYPALVATYYPTTYGSTPIETPGIASKQDGSPASATSARTISYQTAQDYKDFKTRSLDQHVRLIENRIKKLEGLLDQKIQAEPPSEQQ